MMDDPAEEPIRVMALHALMYCERLFYLEEVEELRLADQAVYAGRQLHEELRKKAEEQGEWAEVELSDAGLGLTGKTDCLKRRNGEQIPFEHKRGYSAREGKKAAAWKADRIQVVAYAMLLEKHLGKPVSEACIRYHADGQTVVIAIDDAMRNEVMSCIDRAREIRTWTDRPPICGNDRLCLRCSLAPACLPEEERLLDATEPHPVRLFPPNRERLVVHVTTRGSVVSRAGGTFRIKNRDAEDIVIPEAELGVLVLHGGIEITTPAVQACAEKGIGIHWVSGAGRYIAGIQAGPPLPLRRIRQYQAIADSKTRLRLARLLVGAKVENGLRYLLRASRSMDRTSTGMDGCLGNLRTTLRSIHHADTVDELRGYEGHAARTTFSGYRLLFRKEVPDSLLFTTRSRRPPRDRFNALLGFGYALLFQNVHQAILNVGLDPVLGFFHTPRSAAPPLVLDMMELFRLVLWDIPLIGSINRLSWDPEGDFSVLKDRVWLSDTGRKKAISLFEERLMETWKHPVTKYSLSYERLLELETRLLEKEWSGKPGLFARMRLR